jgi:hypothetical protein
MSFIKRLKDSLAVDRIEDEAFYELVLHEAQNSPRRNGLWAKAIIQAGNQEKAEAVYLKLLAQAMKDEAYLSKRIIEIENKKDADNKASQKLVKVRSIEENKYPKKTVKNENTSDNKSVGDLEISIKKTVSKEDLIKIALIKKILDKTFCSRKSNAVTPHEEAALQIERFELEIDLEELTITELEKRHAELK